MLNIQRPKKKLIISYKNLSDDLRILFRDAYPDGYKEYIQKAYKPNGEPLFVVPLETEDTSYLIKFDVKVDTLHAEDLEKEMFDIDDKAGDDDFSTMTEALEKEDEMTNNHTERVLNHGSYDGMMDELSGSGKKKKGNSDLDELRKELNEEFGDDEDDEEYKDDYTDEGDEDDDIEPSAEDLADIDEEFLSDLTTPAKPSKAGKSSKTAKTTKKTSSTESGSEKTATKTTKTTKTASTAKKKK